MVSKRMTTIAISAENWERLNAIKKIGESHDDTITRLLDKYMGRDK